MKAVAGVELMDYEKLASREEVEKTMESLKTRGISAEFVNTREDALKRVKELIPPGAEVMTGGSTTLAEIGFVDILKSGKHPWKNLKDEIFAEKDEEKQSELRKKSVLSEYFLGSVHAVAHSGEMVIASASGSQLPAYVFTSSNVIWVVGVQKIMLALDKAVKRVREYVLPLEDARMKREGFPGSTIGKLLIFEREIDPERKLRLIFVNEKLGF